MNYGQILKISAGDFGNSLTGLIHDCLKPIRIVSY